MSQVEPYTGRELQAWLTSQGYTFHHQTGDHVFYAKDGKVVPAGNARADQHCTAPMAARTAAAFGDGCNAKWLREQLGHSSLNNGRGGKVRRVPPPPTARHRAIQAIDAIAHLGFKMNRDRATLTFSERHADELDTISRQLARLHKEFRKAA